MNNHETEVGLRGIESMTKEELLENPDTESVWQKHCLAYLMVRGQDINFFEKNYMPELSPDGYLVCKDGTLGPKPSTNIEPAGDHWVMEQTKRELLGNPEFVQPVL